MYRCLTILLCSSLFFAPASGQDVHRYQVQQFTTENGLPSNGIKGLAWDKQTGFLWIASEAGIVRYNGMSFKTYTSDDDPHITNERILFLVRNNAGTIYAADNPGNIFSVKQNTISFSHKQNISGNASSNIATLWVSDRLYRANHRFDNGPFTLQFGRALPINDTASFFAQYGKIYYFSLSMKQPLSLNIPIDRLATSFKSNDRIFLSDHQKDIWMIDNRTFSLSKVPLLFDNDQTTLLSQSFILWENGMEDPLLFSGDKAWKLEYVDGKLKAQLICEQLPQEPLIRYAQYDERLKTLFIGTDSKGILVISKNRVQPVRKERSNPGERTSYYSQVELPDGNILTNEGNILGDKPVTLPGFSGKFHPNTLMMGDSVFWFFQTSTNASYLHSYHFKSRRLTRFDKIRENYSQSALIARDNTLYFSNESGIYRMEKDSLRLLYKYPGTTNQNIHFDMKEVHPGIVGIATCNALLQYNILDNKLDTIYNAGNYCVRTLWAFKDYIFFGTYGNGLFISKNGVVKALPLDKQRYLLFTHCFVDDGKGYCWISTNRGLFKANIAELVNAYENDTEQVYYHYYGRNDGMDITEMNGGCMPCGLIKKDRTISFPTMEGLLWVDPVNAIAALPDGEIFIDNIEVDNKKITLASLEQNPLGAKNRSLRFSLGFAAWCNKENIYLQYRLNNDPEWISLKTDNEAVIQFNNLTKGDYRLQIRKLNGFGVNNYSYKEIRFSIPTPWFEQTWFYVVAIFLVTTLIVLYFRYRTRVLRLRQRKLEQQVSEKTRELLEQNEQLEKNNTIKTKLISIISHDIITPLKFVNVAGKNLIEKKDQMSEDLQKETLQEIANTSQELQLLSTNILNWIKYQNENRRLAKESFNLFEMVNQVFSILRSLARQKNLRLSNEIPIDMSIYQFYEPVKILVYNLLTNAIHFTEKGTITVRATGVGDEVTISVKDEGVGMTPEQLQRLLEEDIVITSANVDNKRGHGLGYLIIKDLVKTVDATLTIESKKDKGTTVSIRLAASKNGPV